jgi:hypothetical protein
MSDNSDLSLRNAARTKVSRTRIMTAGSHPIGWLRKSVRGQQEVDVHGVVRKIDGAVGIAFQYPNV